MKQLLLVGLVVSIAAFAPASSHQCRELRDSVLLPLKNVRAYLEMNPDPEALSGAGCVYLLQQLKGLSQGADMIRALGTQTASNVSSRCVYPINAIQFVCGEGAEARCSPQSYTYCGQWAYSVTYESHYELAMELASKIDTAFNKAQQLCGAAFRRDDEGALALKQDLANYLDEATLPRGEKVFSAACGD